ncbi:hypothetical protein DFJ74DRAFT_311923 [Hyaloraphidium curvatum]|nr:hypothetical protein DFJ74DRAFT_311923 [Hyaloraphidium curvatum]
MIKLVYVISRRPELTPEQFHEHWLNTHGPLVKAHAKALKIRKYVQSHLIRDHPGNEPMRRVRGMLPPVDGITEVWYDSLEDRNAGYATPEGELAAKILDEDERKFIDFKNSQVFLTKEHLIFDHTGGKLPDDCEKNTYLLSAKEGLTQEECHRTWLNDHGPLVASFAKSNALCRYIQSHAVHDEVNQAIAKSERGYMSPLDGITEVWISKAEAAKVTDRAAARKGAAAMAEDERRFVQMDRSRCFMTKEHVIFDYTGDAARL